MTKAQNATQPPNRDAVSEQQAAESGNEEKESPTMISSITDQKDDEEEAAKLVISNIDLEKEFDNILSQPPLDSLFFDPTTIKEEKNEEPSQTQTETSSKKGKQVIGDVSMNDSSTLSLDRSFLNQLNLNEEPSQTETCSKKVEEVAGDVSKNDSSKWTFPFDLNEKPSETETETETSTLPLDSNKRKEGPETETSSAETPPKIRRVLD